MKYLLDTNICIYIIKKKPEHVLKKFSRMRKAEMYLSSITIAELIYGVEKSQCKDRNMDALDGFSAPFDCVQFCHESAKIFGQLRAELEKKGTMIGVFDLQIASIAIANDMTLVTNNEKEYARVSGIKIENWTKED